MAFETIENSAKQIVLTVQDYSLFAYRAMMNLFRPPVYWTDFLIQADIIGVGSLSIVVLSGRNASSMASELGSMVVTEQIDAMRALGVDPIRKLVTPRIFSTIAMLFFLTIVSDAFGILGGGIVTVFLNHQDGTQYLNMAWEHLRLPDIVQGLMKPIFFGYILSSVGCFYGMRTTGGTEGVGRSTISAVVTASVLIIFVDFFITRLLLNVFASWN
jgi:phospholipid/cholesterol/gamma-HCH transport system permease protein